MASHNQNSLTIHISAEELKQIVRSEIAHALVANRTSQKHIAEELLSPSQISKLIGLSSKQVIRLISSGDIAGFRLGKLLKAKRSAVELYLKACDLSQVKN